MRSMVEGATTNTGGASTPERPLIRLGFASPPSPSRGEGQEVHYLAVEALLPLSP